MRYRNDKIRVVLKRHVLVVAAVLYAVNPLLSSAVVMTTDDESFVPSWSLGPVQAADQSNSPVATSLRKVIELIEKGRLEEAENQLEGMISAFSDSASVFELYGSVLAMQGKLNEAEEAFRKGLKIDATSPDLLTKLGTLKYSMGDIQEAEKLLLESIKLKPGSRFAHQQLGLLYEVESPLKARAHLEKGLQGVSESYVGIRVNLARLYNASGEYEKAAQQLSGRLNSKSSAESYLVLGTAQYKLKEYQKAIKSFELAREASADPEVMLLPLGIAYKDAGELKKAKLSFEGYMAHKPEDHKSYYQLGRLHQSQKENSQAKAMFKKALKRNPKSLGSAMGLAEVYVSEDDQSSAISVLEQARKQGLVHRDLFLSLANIYLLQGQQEKALSTIDSFVRLSRESIESLFVQGNFFAASGRYENAETSYRKLLKKQSDNLPALKALSVVYHRRGLYEDSIQTARLLLKESPGRENEIFLATLLQSNGENKEAAGIYRQVLKSQVDVVALNNLSAIELAQGEYEDALRYAEQAASISKDNPNIQDSYGWALYHNGRLGKSAEVLQAAIRLERQHEFLYHLGAVYAKQGNTEKAVGLLEESLKTSRVFSGKEDAKVLLDSLLH